MTMAPASSRLWFERIFRASLLGHELPVFLGISLIGALIGYLSVNDHRRSAIAISLLPFIVWFIIRPRWAIVMLGVSIPFAVSLVGGSAGGLNVAASDVLLTLIFCTVAMQGLLGGHPQIAPALRPLVVPFAPYLGWMVVLAAAHLGVVSSLQSGQRIELFVFPVVIGVVVSIGGYEALVLRAYLTTTILFASLYPLFSNEAGGLGAQKNPAGGFIACALLLVISIRDLREKFKYGTPFLILGLFWTQSRGAIVSVLVGLVVLLLMHPGRDKMKFLALMIPVSAVAAGAFALLPDAAQERNISFESGTDSRAEYSLEIRETFRAEAWQMIHAEPLLGTGVGRYVQGVGNVRPTTVDPHQVLLLQAAEGGYLLAAGFVILILGTAAVIFWRGRHTDLGPAAVALLIATVGHGLVDVYWVRGTPVLGWLVVGMAMGQIRMDQMRKNQTRERAETYPS
jgi:hypothetical protein